ncbi:glycosyl hydrolase 53 family protein [Actinomadura sp. WMMA1423]|uniref:glycosyl hydrolase 53 family protein n=1 Tax=Actinomadura sp. WMMA1423 TaxID=2591108 RepID=UPI0011461DE3|nr:glycosyl hydrolase 53 family protein [Actinomadura sp. WMMA1423]
MNTPTPRPSLNRRGFLLASAAAGVAAAVPLTGARAASSPASASGPFRTALSVSPFTEKVLDSVSLTDGARTASTVTDVQRLFKAHGATEVYARIATRRQAQSGDAQHGFDRGLQRARLARNLGLPFNPELGLWAVYGDMSYQPEPDFTDYPAIKLPGQWTTLTIDQMVPALRRYGALVAAQILLTGAQVKTWDLGNEVEFGVAGVAIRSLVTQSDGWTYSPPDAVDPAIGEMDFYTLISMAEDDRIAWLQTHLWPHVGRLLAATAEGIRSVYRGARFSTHTSTVAAASSKLSTAFWQAMSAAGFRADELGTSFYPTSNDYGDRLAIFKDVTTTLQSTFGKKVFVAELGYPSATMSDPYAWNSPLPGYPISPQGAHDFVRDLVAWGGGTSGPLSGVRPWAPDYCTAGWQPMSHFTVTGTTATADPVLNAIAQGLQQAAGG